MKAYLRQKIKDIEKISKITGDASDRGFFRLSLGSRTVVAMVYPPGNNQDIRNVIHFTEIYRKHHIPVPRIIEVIDHRIVIQEDLGSQLIQKRFPRIDENSQKKLVARVADILLRLKRIPVCHTKSRLDESRMLWEMNFFCTHFARHFFKSPKVLEEIKRETSDVVNRIAGPGVFLHRDFHSRNMLYHRNRIYMVDFQDSLVGPEYYDLASFAFDAYLDVNQHRERLFHTYEQRGKKINREQLYITALQRNVKALGTFGFQINVRKRGTFNRYIPRTIRHITGNPLARSLTPSLYSILQSRDFNRTFFDVVPGV